MKKLLFAAVLTAGTLCSASGKAPVFDFDFKNSSGMTLHRKAQVADGTLKLSGKGDFVSVPGTEKQLSCHCCVFGVFDIGSQPPQSHIPQAEKAVEYGKVFAGFRKIYHRKRGIIAVVWRDFCDNAVFSGDRSGRQRRSYVTGKGVSFPVRKPGVFRHEYCCFKFRIICLHHTAGEFQRSK